MIRRMLLGVGFLAWSLGVLASKPYIEHKYQYTQPNGDVVTIILNGDDYFGEQHSLDGELVMYDETVGGMVYATVNEERTQLLSTGELVEPHDFDPSANRYIRRRGLSSGSKEEESSENKEEKLGAETEQKQQLIVLTREQVLQERATYASGNVQGLTIIIQFPDELGNITKSQVEDFLNNVNYSEFGNSTSVRGYFHKVSNGELDYTNTVTKYYTAENSKAYYTDDNHSSTVRSRELILEALNWLEHTEGFDFSTLSTDQNDKIMGLNVLYAGEVDSAWSRGLWPHMGKLMPGFCADGVCTDRYQITNMGDELNIGPFVHETSHMLYRWPDLFDYDASSHGSVAKFGLMGFGAAEQETQLKPVAPNGYFRYLAGWITATELNPQVNPEAMHGELSHTAGSGDIYRWSNPNRMGEAFYIENIYQAGQNEHQPDSGLAIWHIDPDGSNNDESLPFVQLEHADGKRDPENAENYGDSTDLFESGTFGFNSPDSDATNSRWSDGTDSELSIQKIGNSAPTQTFILGEEDVAQPVNTYEFSGYLYHNEVRVEPYDSWFYTNGDSFSFELEGPSYADFDMYLQHWDGQQWVYIAASQSYTSSESIQYNLAEGYYRVLVHSYNGSGYYDLTIQ